MKRSTLLSAIPALIGLATIAAPLRATELPANIADAIHHAYPTAKIDEVDQEKEDGILAYEVEIEIGERELTLKYDEHAQLLETEEELSLDQLPAAVAAAYHQAAPHETSLEIVKSTSAAEGIRYEIKSRGEHGKREFLFTETGTLIATKNKKHDDEEDEDEDGDEEQDDAHHEHKHN